MNSIELAPTIENILQTLSDDVLKRNEDVVHFYRLLYSLGGYSAIALDGKWGSGKTFFVKQVILLAKALNKKTGLYIFDEPTSALDKTSKETMNEIIFNISGTVIFITHELSIAQRADKILVLQNGQLVEIGSHKELLNANGFYANIFAKQVI